MPPPAEDTVARMFAAHAAALRLYASQWVGPAAADDVVQRVFVRLLTGGRLPADPRTWLFRCVRNEAIDAARSARRRNRREQAIAADADRWFVSRKDDPLDAAAAEAALAAVPERDREVVTLRIWSGLTLAEVAAVTGMPVSTHDGRPPDRLDELTNLPVPVDEVTGKPFGYRSDGQTAILDAPAPAYRSQASGWRLQLKFEK